MNKQEELQINTLMKWVNVRLAPSEIDGVGVVALRDIEKGTKLYLDIMPEIFNLPYARVRNQLPQEIGDVLLGRWPQIKNGSAFVYPDARYVAYMNHSPEPNYSAKEDVTLRYIKAGEEITEDYKLIEGYEEVFDFNVV